MSIPSYIIYHPFTYYTNTQSNTTTLLHNLQEIDSQTYLYGLPIFDKSYSSAINISMTKENMASIIQYLDGVCGQKESVSNQEHAFITFLQVKLKLLLIKLLPLSDEEIRGAKMKASYKFVKLSCLFETLKVSNYDFWCKHHKVIGEIGDYLSSLFLPGENGQQTVTAILDEYMEGAIRPTLKKFKLNKLD